jgi:SAM-dependent methyltransferase
MDTEAFRDFDRAAGGYHDFFEPVTGGAIATLLDAAGARAGCRVLDVATGPGAVAAAAAARGASRVVGVDLSPRMVALAASLHAGVEFREADAEALPFDAGECDAVVSNFGVGHFPRPARALAEVTRVLARGGMAAVSWWDLPARNRVNGVFFEAVSRAGAPPPPGLPAGPAVFRFSHEAELVAVLRTAGLEGVAVRDVTWVHAVASAEAWWQGRLGSLARASARILGQAPEMQRKIRASSISSSRRMPSRAAFARRARPGSRLGGSRDPPGKCCPATAAGPSCVRLGGS